MTNDLVSYVENGRQRRPAFVTSLPHKYQKERRNQKAGLLWRPFSQHKNKVIGHLVCLGRKSLWEERFICDKNTFCPIRKRMYFLSQMYLLLKRLFCLYKPNDQWPCLLCWENGRQKGPFESTSLPHKYQRKPKAGLLWRPFLNIRFQGHWSFGFAYAEKTLKEDHLWQKSYSDRFTKEKNVFLSRMNLLLKDFSAYTKPNDQ